MVRLDKTSLIIIICTVLIILVLLFAYNALFFPQHMPQTEKRKKKGDGDSQERHEVKSEAPQETTGEKKEGILVQHACPEDEQLAPIRKQIFPLQVTDIKLTAGVVDEPHYWRAVNLLKSYHRKYKKTDPTVDELLTLLVYKKFVDHPDIYSMCSENDVDQLKMITLDVLRSNVRGCFIETGCWKGGMISWMKALDKEFGDPQQPRKIYGFDVFGKFPKPEGYSETSGQRKDVEIHEITEFLYENFHSLTEVGRRINELGLLDEHIIFAQGLLEDTIPQLEITMSQEGIAILRIDNDYYNSVLMVLEYYYKYVSKGGYVIVDDYNNSIVGCKEATDYFRSKYNITAPIIDDYNASVYWQKE